MKTNAIARIVSAMPRGMGLGFSFSQRRILEAAHAAQAPKRSDVEALRSDWIKVGGDLRAAIQKFQPGNPR